MDINYNNKKDISKFIRYDINGLMDNQKKIEMDSPLKIDDRIGMSDKMLAIYKIINENLSEKLLIIDHYLNKEIECLETQTVMLFLDDDILYIQMKYNTDVTIAVQLGIILNSIATHGLVRGFKFLDSYIVVEDENDKMKYLYGDEAKEACEEAIFRHFFATKHNETFKDSYIKNVNIDELPSC